MGVEGTGALARHLRLGTCHIAVLLAAASLLATGGDVAHAADAGAPAQAPSSDAVNQALLKKIEALEQRIKSLETRDKQQSTAADSPATPKTQSKSGKRDDAPAASTDPATA